MRRSLPLALVTATFICSTADAQVLNGRVMTESGENASKVSVRFQNRANGITTRSDGTFNITATSLPDTLVFSAPGYEPYKVVITEKNIKDPNFEVVLLNQRKELSEVVITGYGAARKKEVSYSTTKVSADAIEKASAEVGAAEVVVTSAYGMGREASGTLFEKDYAGKEVSGKAAGLRVRGTSSYDSRTAEETLISFYKDDPKLFISDTSIGPRTGIVAKSRILTAGEVNDFNKWKMWEDYSANEFRALGIFWGMLPNNRYAVQLTDKNLNAVINEPVYLVRRNSKDTVWKAFTDNTGKAELWSGFFRDSLKAEYYITDNRGNRIDNPSSFSNGVNFLNSNLACNVSADVDIAFVVDATGSMGDEIEFLKLELEDVIRNTMEKHRSLSLRAASVFYRDKGDEYVSKKADFHDDLLKTLNFIKLQKAGGGGDTPEALDAAMSMALDSLQWNPKARTRLLFLILDAPPHNEGKERIRKLIFKAAAMGIRIVPVACSGTDKSTEFLLRSMALATNGTYAFLTNHSGIGNPHIEPTTDKYEVELLGNLLQRIIGQYLYAKECAAEDKTVQQPTRHPGNILSVKLYPNPTSGLFTIESTKDIKEIYIADFTGKILLRLAAADKKGRWQVDIGRYPSGTYLVKYITADNKWGADKVVLMR
jgi:CarboxypepD_reg-like domain/Secretion system C-terminal sorting domain/von Willebrand factor type A domain